MTLLDHADSSHAFNKGEELFAALLSNRRIHRGDTGSDSKAPQILSCRMPALNFTITTYSGLTVAILSEPRQKPDSQARDLKI